MDRLLHLVPPATKGNLVTMMVHSYYETNSSANLDLSASTRHGESLFNFSMQEAYRILKEHQMNERILYPGAEIALILTYSILMTSGVVSNALVCFVVGRQCARKRSSGAASPSPRNMYIVNLAVADIALCLVCMPFTLISLLKRRWTLGSMLCKLVPVLQGANISVSAGTIAAIALDRYFTIVRPRRSQACQGAVCSVASVISIVWGLSFVTMIPLLIFQEVETISYGELILYEACVEKWPSKTWQICYTGCLMMAQFLVPFLVLSIIHLKISTYLAVRVSTPPRDANSKRAKREWRRNRRTMVILTCIAVVFAISWLPMTVFSLVAEINPSILGEPSTMYAVFAGCHILAMSSACTNPLLYGWLNTNFRRELATVLRLRGHDPEGQTEGHDAKEAITRGVAPNSVTVRAGDRRISLTFLTSLTTATGSHRGASTTAPSVVHFHDNARAS
ncbi:neuropeptide F receptor [Nilaparvata lugens]|uniref:neuropeptide F receptor n=1 Tax=Nilaparvata lugens TaxID=108931 RepID=UPI00193E1B4B|nr:neuropeptide F receptor [Nilaparvata lugens]XP_039300489.1 neuropeptide F receptor [Nilaparvata lugens]